MAGDCLVLYLEFTSPRQERLLRKVVGGDGAWQSMLPRIHPLPDAEASQRLLPAVQDVLDAYPEGVAACFVQPSDESRVALSFDEMVAAVHATAWWREFVQDAGAGAVRFHSREYARCWVVAAQPESVYIGSGLGLVVDKHSRTVLVRRYVDVCDLAGVPEQ